MSVPLNRVARMRRLRREDGAEAVEFALIAPLLFFLVFGLIYLLVLFAAQVSLGYATNVGARYASIGSPAPAEVLDRATAATPFFSASDCNAQIVGGAGANQPLNVTMNCTFPNPAGGAANGLRNGFFGGGETIPNTVTMSATAQSRRE